MTPESLINLLIKDIADRKGIGDEWDQIEEEIQREIRAAWIAMATQAIGAAVAEAEARRCQCVLDGEMFVEVCRLHDNRETRARQHGESIGLVPYRAVQRILDEVIGGCEEDGAGAGIEADVRLALKVVEDRGLHMGEARAREKEGSACAVLCDVEWSYAQYAGEVALPACPSCYNRRSDGHAPDCRLAAAIRARGRA